MISTILYFILFDIILLFVLYAFLLKNNLKLLKKYHSPISGTIEIRQTKDGEKRMMMDYYTQGLSIEQITNTSSYWHRAAIFALKHVKDKPQPHILTIGLGACTVPNLIALQNPDIKQTLIEIDPIVIQACRDYFQLDQLPNHTLIESDIYKLQDKDEFKNQFDVILFDILTTKAKQALTPQEETLVDKLYLWLKRDGILLFNRPSHTPQLQQDAQKLTYFLNQKYHHATMESVVDDRRGFENTIICVTK